MDVIVFVYTINAAPVSLEALVCSDRGRYKVGMTRLFDAQTFSLRCRLVGMVPVSCAMPHCLLYDPEPGV